MYIPCDLQILKYFQDKRQGRKRRFSLNNRGGETMKKIRFDEDNKEHDESTESIDIQGQYLNR